MTALPPAPRLIALNAPSAAGGVPLSGGHDFDLDSGSVEFRLDRLGKLRFRCKRLPAWYPLAVPKQTVFYVDLVAHGIVSEWLYVGDVLDDTSPLMELIGEPLDYILRDVGPMRDYVSGGGANYVQGLADGTAENYLDEFVLPYLTVHGYTWITKGTIETVTRHPVAWDRWTPLRLLNELEERTKYEFRLQRTGQIDFLERINGSAPVPVIAAGKNLQSLQRTRSPEGFFSVVQAFGGVPAGGVNHATSGLAFVTVGDVTGSVVTLSPNIVALDDQYNGNCLQKIDGSRTQITDSAVAGTVTVSDATGISEGDTVLIVADSDGTLLEEVADPNAVARVVGTWQSDDYRGEANLAANPFVETWPTKPSSGFAKFAANYNDGVTSVQLTGVEPSNREFKAGDALSVRRLLGHSIYRVTGDATASGGVVTLSIDPPLAQIPFGDGTYGVRTGWPVVYFNLTDPPTGWTDVQEGTSGLAIFQHRKTDVSDLTGTIAALHDYTYSNPATTTVAMQITIGGLTPGDVIYVGDAVVFSDASDAYRYVMVGGTVDGAGEVKVTLDDNRPTSVVGDTVRVVRIAVPDDPLRTPSSESILLLTRRLNANTDTTLGGAVLNLGTVTVPYLPSAPNIWLKAGLTVRGDGSVNPTGGLRTPKLQIWSGSTLLQEVIAPAFTLGASNVSGRMGDPRAFDQQIELSCGITLTAPLAITARLIGCHRVDTLNLNAGPPFTQVRWAMLQVGSDDQAAPPISGAHGTKLRLVENEILKTKYLLPEQIVVDSRERSADFTISPPEAKIQYGADARIMNPWTSTDTLARCVAATYDLVDPDATRFVVTTRHQEATDKIERRFRRLEEGSLRTSSVANATSGLPTDPPVVVVPPDTTPGGTPGTGSTPTVGGRDIFVIGFATPPTPTNVGNLWFIPDRGAYKQWDGSEWMHPPESSLADLRVAQADGAPLAMLLDEYQLLRFGFTLDTNGAPVATIGEAANFLLVDGESEFLLVDELTELLLSG